ncbi:MAG: hypothetical protein EZS28_041744, partial [Streblomastix strix]
MFPSFTPAAFPRLPFVPHIESKNEKENGNQWTLNDEYYALLEESYHDDFSILHARCPIYLGGRDFQGRRIVVIIAAYLDKSTDKNLLLHLFMNKLDAIKFDPYIIVLNCTNLYESGDFSLQWDHTLYNSLPYAFKKNMKQVLIVRPSKAVRTLINLA